MGPEITIIIPFYNESNYIEESVASVLCQTFDSIQLVLVDDASEDDSLEKALKTAAEEKNIEIIRHQQNFGLAASRNSGLQRARGTYIMFLDADDQLESDACGQLYNAAVRERADIVAGETWWRNQYGFHIPVRYLKENFKKEAMDNCRDSDSFPISVPTVTGKMFRSELLTRHSIHFPPVRHGEDIAFSLYSWFFAQKITLLERIVYLQRRRTVPEGPSLSSNKTFFYIKERTDVLSALLAFCTEKSLEKTKGRLLKTSLWFLLRTICSIQSEEEKKKAINLLLTFLEENKIDKNLLLEYTYLTPEELYTELFRMNDTDFLFHTIYGSLLRTLNY